MTIAIANGYAIARSPDARRGWETVRARRGQARAAQTPAEFRATLGRLAAMFPGAVKVH